MLREVLIEALMEVLIEVLVEVLIEGVREVRGGREEPEQTLTAFFLTFFRRGEDAHHMNKMHTT